VEYRDYYEVMGVARDATQDEIKRAYRKMARKYHPDVSKEEDSEEHFKALGEAYEVLKDPEKRAAYDQLGANWQQGQDFQPPPGWDQNFEFRGGSFETGSDFSDFFSSLFGQTGGRGQGGQADGFGRQGRRGQAFAMQGEDHHARVLIDLEDSINGTSREITLRLPQVTPDGHVDTTNRVLNVKIPKGIKPGQRIRLAGQGGPGHGGGPAGDLYLEVDIRPHARYQLEGDDITLELPVTPWEAALGTTIVVAIPTGNVELKIPPGSDQGSRLRLKGKGLPGKKPGDLFVELTVRIPKADTEAARALYQQMEKDIPFNPRATQATS
jgi:curved DNA-binding protein